MSDARHKRLSMAVLNTESATSCSIMESTLRSINNLLERFHASFFFYLLTHPGWFIKIGNYLPAAILLGAGLTVEGLRMWIESGWVRVRGHTKGEFRAWKRRGRKVDLIVKLFGVAFLAGLGRLKAQRDWVSGSGVSLDPAHERCGRKLKATVDNTVVWNSRQHSLRLGHPYLPYNAPRLVHPRDVHQDRDPFSQVG